MPNYDYACPKCGHEWEVFQSMKDDPIKTCPSCKKRSAKRLVGGGAGLIFKGSGFYITDYKNKSGGDSAKPAAPSAPAAAKKSAD
ncbi:FmdB family zinc ribbon protein [Synoicihabitans lomoniglobus]|uniref:Zinc ribbon domain-containing protein n=1 Tax=Synoicihabitans lomoniglobus TaxID=2909285 RepID=A0AAF0I213_9BACT|nr:zinc ribbon domain-containing protein [Opitutaceae bacterium LMO-M01]WED66192.1 zinc ribbon domain-containing protein [Opitutaceae bacterium LMO-M01]